MKVHLLSLLSVVLVLSIKAYEISAHEQNNERRVSVFQQDITLTNNELVNSISSFDSLVLILAESNTVKERQVGFSGATPKEFRAYEELQDLASEEELNGLLTHYSPIVRIYAYRALINNEMEVDASYEESILRDTTEVDWFSGCILRPSTVQDLASGNP